MPDCLHCPLCEFARTNILHKRAYTTYCSKHLLETIQYMKDKLKQNRWSVRSEMLLELREEIVRRYYHKSGLINKEVVNA